MLIQSNTSLKKFNTFGIDAKAQFFTSIQNIAFLQTFIKKTQNTYSILPVGEGSNILFAKKKIAGLVMKMDIKGIIKIKENKQYVWVKAGAGVGWHDLVLYCIQHHYGGIENLSLIPGSVGAAPIQNIGAYGVEIKEVLDRLSAVEIATGKIRIFDNKTCEFGYRSSVFKKKLKEQYIIVDVTLKLHKKHTFCTNYGAIVDTLDAMQVKKLSIKAISEAVIHIRKSKLPDPTIIGNAGSFFKNPIIETSSFLLLQKKFTDLPGYALHSGYIKIPAAWLITYCGWKGKHLGYAGVHALQPLVLINLGNATGKEVQALAQAIQKDVHDTFGIKLAYEVNII